MRPTMTPQEKADIVEAFSRHLNRGQVAYLRAGHLDVLETMRQGIGFTDPVSGRRMVDCFTSAGCFNVGRSNYVVKEALVGALRELDMGTSHLLSRHKLALAEKLAQLAPGDLNRVHFAAGGGDAVDAALKLARAATGRVEVVATHKAYHGHTGFALSANGKPHYRNYCEPLMPGFRFVPFNDLEAVRRQLTGSTACVLVEPVQGEAGIFIGSDEYLQGLRRICDEAGCLLIFDEIQTGFGRTGRLFAAQHSGVVPDIMTIAKSMGGGLFPNAAMLYRDDRRLTSYVNSNPDFHPGTGGSDLGCVVSLKVLEYIEREGLCDNAARRGRRFLDGLECLRRENPRLIKEVRGIGLMLGIEYIHEFMGPMMSDALARQGVFAAYSGNAPQVMRFMLPLTVAEEEVEAVLEAVRAAVAQMKPLAPLALPAARIPPLLRLLNDERVQTRLFGSLRKLEDLAGHLMGRSGGES